MDRTRTSSPRRQRICIVVSRYNDWVTAKLEQGALDEAAQRGIDPSDLTVVHVPGAFELPVAAGRAARGGFDAVVCLGCLIRGETPHDRHIANGVSDALANLSAQTGVPIGFGLLTCLDADQAEARAGGAMGNKGVEAMAAVIETLAALEKLGSPQRSTPAPA